MTTSTTSISVFLFHYRFEAKRVIIRQGHKAENFYFILSGTGKQIHIMLIKTITKRITECDWLADPLSANAKYRAGYASYLCNWTVYRLCLSNWTVPFIYACEIGLYLQAKLDSTYFYCHY